MNQGKGVIEINMIKELIKKKGVTQLKVSEDTGINLSTIRNYCKGHSKPKLEKATILGEYFDVAPSLLMGATDEKEMSLNDARVLFKSNETLTSDRLSDNETAQLRHMAVTTIDFIQDLNEKGEAEDIQFAKQFLEEFRFLLYDSLDPKEEGKKFEIHEPSMAYKVYHINKLIHDYLKNKPKYS